ncbi:MAG TPA: hypothetical protein PLJ30_08775 [Deltaproteobacteria bacterium]|nr:hypothetical protein [Deltaproteobacteria bacterium]
MIDTILIKKRFCGPPDSGNGGYVCGMLAQYLDGVVEVRLMKPPPLEKPLFVEHTGDGRVQLKNGDAVIAEARKGRLDIETPDPPSFEEAREAMTHYVSEDEHFFPTCFVCGPARREKDGLRIFPGRVPDRLMVASAWVPDETLSDVHGVVRPEFVWASLDCPGAFAVLGAGIGPIVLGSITAEILKHPTVGENCIAVGWEIASEGRKRFAGTALFSETGSPLARARAIWFEI